MGAGSTEEGTAGTGAKSAMPASFAPAHKETSWVKCLGERITMQ